MRGACRQKAAATPWPSPRGGSLDSIRSAHSARDDMFSRRGIPSAPNGACQQQPPPPCAARVIPGGSRGAGSPRCQTVPPSTRRASNCASDDTQWYRLCIRRQLGPVSGRSLSPEAQFDAPAVAGDTVWAAGCRQRHSLGRPLSPEAQFDRHAVVRHATHRGCRRPTKGT